MKEHEVIWGLVFTLDLHLSFLYVWCLNFHVLRCIAFATGISHLGILRNSFVCRSCIEELILHGEGWLVTSVQYSTVVFKFTGWWAVATCRLQLALSPQCQMRPPSNLTTMSVSCFAPNRSPQVTFTPIWWAGRNRWRVLLSCRYRKSMAQVNHECVTETNNMRVHSVEYRPMYRLALGC